jgi:hypothetical protein
MKQILLILIVFTLSAKFLFSQINLNNNTDSNSLTSNAEIDKKIRSSFLFFSIGGIELGSIGVGYQVRDNFSFALKGSAAWIGSSAEFIPNGARGFGIRLTYHKPFFFFNTASFEYILYTHSTLDWEWKKRYNEIEEIPTLKGYYLEFNIGRETINESGFNFFWAIGIYKSAAKEADILYGPSLKIGLNYNFFK